MVYFVQAGDDGPIKIGYVDGEAIEFVEKRVALMQVGNWAELHIRATMPGGITVEQRVHKIFEKGRIRGEWFRPDTPELLGSIEYLRERAKITAWQLRDDGLQLCEWCKTGIVPPPRRSLCSDACAKEAKADAQARRRRKSPRDPEETSILQGKDGSSGDGGNRTRALFPPSDRASA